MRDFKDDTIARRAPASEEPAAASEALRVAALQRRAQKRRAERRQEEDAARGERDPRAVAERGLGGASGSLPHLEAIQRSFGRHDVSEVHASVGGSAAEACDELDAEAYASGRGVAFQASPDLHTAAHEAAHVVQQRAGVHLKGGVGKEGDVYERHADAVADQVARGQSAEALLDQHAGGSGGKPSVQLVKDKNKVVKKGGSKKQRQRYVGKLGTDPAFLAWFHKAKQDGTVSRILGRDVSRGQDSVDAKDVRKLYAEYQKTLAASSNNADNGSDSEGAEGDNDSEGGGDAEGDSDAEGVEGEAEGDSDAEGVEGEAEGDSDAEGVEGEAEGDSDGEGVEGEAEGVEGGAEGVEGEAEGDRDGKNPDAQQAAEIRKEVARWKGADRKGAKWERFKQNRLEEIAELDIDDAEKKDLRALFEEEKKETKSASASSSSSSNANAGGGK
jgi:hypothetical protein